MKGKKMEKIAEEFKKLTWQEMNDFAERITQFATDDEGKPNGATYIAQCLLDWADEATDDIT